MTLVAALGPELPLWEGVVRLLVVAVLAGVVGIERELRDQEAGLRTHMLVGMGAALFVLTANFAWSEVAFGDTAGVVLDPSRVVAYVVTGIGFLGAGAIIKHGLGVKGLTTAASLWVVAAVGVTVGAGDYALGVVAAVLVVASLWPVRRLADAVGLRRDRTHRLQLELAPDAGVAAVIGTVEKEGRIVSIRVRDEAESRHLEIVLVEHGKEIGSLATAASSLPGVREAIIAT
jgi:putative Mg2+ transporter-C (MgtC) family protein